MEKEELKAWMAEHGVTVRGLASDLGIHFVTVQRYRDGSLAVPPWFGFALAGLLGSRTKAKR